MKISNLSKLNGLNLFFVLFSLTSIGFVALINPALLSLMLLPILAIILKETKAANSFKKGFEVFPLFVFLALLALRVDLFILISALLVSSMSAKFVVSKEPSDYFEIFIVGLMLSLLSSIGTISFLFGINAMLFLISSFFFLVETQFKEKLALGKTIPHKKDISIFITISFVLTLVLFYSLPRFTLGVVHGNPITARATTNFSTDISIDANPVSLDYTIVMRVEKEKGNTPLYVSGLRYSTFLNGKWYKSEQKEKIYPDILGNFLDNSGKKATIYLEPNNTDVIFKVDYSTGLYGNFRYIYRDNLDNLYFDAPFFKTIKYDTFFENSPSKTFLNHNDLLKFLDLRGINPEIVNLGKEITKGKTSPNDKINAILNYLRNNNEYSLTPTSENIDDFILNHKSGYCEHFATAFVILARTSNIPSRLVSGFVTTEWNNNLKYYIVRAKDAHTWAEVYINDTWVRVDPTPPSEVNTSKFSLFVDTIRMFWYRNFVTYSSESQTQLFEKFFQGFTNFGNTTFNFFKALQKNNIYIPLICILLIGIFIFKNMETKSVDYLARKIISLIGNDKNDNETILEFARRKSKENTLKEIIELYYEYRYAKKYELRSEIYQRIKKLSSQK